MQYTTYLRWGVLGGLFLVPFIPFIIASGEPFPSLFFPFITGKNFTFRLIVELILGLYVLLALREPQYRPRASLVGWAFLAFVAWMGLATVLSVEPVKSFWSNFERMEGYVGLLHIFAYFVVASAVLSATNLWQRFFNVSIFASAVMGLVALGQVFGVIAISTQSGSRVDATFGNATYTAVYFLIHFFLTLFMLAHTLRERKNNALVVGYTGTLILQFVGLYFTETRGALLGLIGGVLVAAVYVAVFGTSGELKKLRRVAIGSIVGLLVLAAGFFAVKDTQFVRELPGVGRLASISLNDPTTQSRLFFIWPMALTGGLERPLTGWGQENFSYIFNAKYDPQMFNQEQWFDRAHNQFLDWLVAGGVPAALLYLSLYVLVAWVVFRSNKLSVPEQAVLLGLVAGYGFNNLFVFDNLVSAIYFATILGFAHYLSRRELPGTVALSKPLSDHAIAIAAPIVALVVCVGGWALNGPAMVRAHTVIDALQTARRVDNGQGVVTTQPRDTAENIAQFNALLNEPAWPGVELGRQEVVEQLLQFASNTVAPSPTIAPQAKEQTFVLAATEGAELLAQRAHDARLELFMGTFLSAFGQFGEAQKHLDTALQLSPRKQQILFQRGLTKIQAGDSAGGLEDLRTAFELAPSFDTARTLYAAGFYFAGQQTQGDALIMETFGTLTPDNDRLLQIYAQTKQWDRVVGIWNARIEQDPKNIALHQNLAEVYFQAGRVEETIAELRVIASLDPNNALQIQQLIEQLESGALKPPTQ